MNSLGRVVFSVFGSSSSLWYSLICTLNNSVRCDNIPYLLDSIIQAFLAGSIEFGFLVVRAKAGKGYPMHVKQCVSTRSCQRWKCWMAKISILDVYESGLAYVALGTRGVCTWVTISMFMSSTIISPLDY